MTQLFSFQCVLVSQLQVKPKEVNILQHLKMWKPQSTQQNIWQLYELYKSMTGT